MAKTKLAENLFEATAILVLSAVMFYVVVSIFGPTPDVNSRAVKPGDNGALIYSFPGTAGW